MSNLMTPFAFYRWRKKDGRRALTAARKWQASVRLLHSSLSKTQLPGFACRHGRSRRELVLLSVCSPPPCSVNAHQLRVVVSCPFFFVDLARGKSSAIDSQSQVRQHRKEPCGDIIPYGPLKLPASWLVLRQSCLALPPTLAIYCST
jgi:hypothetical protein